MVQMASSGSLQLPVGDKLQVKLEMEDQLEDEHGPFNKKLKQSISSALDQCGSGSNAFPVLPSQYNPLDEPSPLGLQLRKSPSLLELIQMRLSQGNASTLGSVPSEDCNSRDMANAKGTSAPTTDKLKAANFPASMLRIGCWEYASRYEGDLVGKCYFAKHKLVWEILEGGLKSKIEIQWSDIMGLKASFLEDGPATLIVVLARQPLFFRETNPQPRKHTLWQATSDFTDGQASLHRKHFLQVPHGLLNKHFDKLMQCDTRLNFLSRQPDIVMDCPYFESQASVFADSCDSKNHATNPLETAAAPSVSVFQDIGTPSVSQTSSITIKEEDAVHGPSKTVSREAPSPSSVMDTRAIEGSASSDLHKTKGSTNFEQRIMQGLRPSMSVSDLVNHIGNCISEEMSSENLPFTEHKGPESCKMLEDIAQHLLSDSQLTVTCSDEKSLMSRVNSLYCLLQKDGGPVQGIEDLEVSKRDQADLDHFEGDVSVCKPTPPAMSRKDSYSDLLLHLPRIASLPKFLFDISEDEDNQAR